MTDTRIAMYAALFAVFGLVSFVLLQGTPQFFYAHWRVLVYGAFLAPTPARFAYTNLEAFGGLVGAVGISAFLATLQIVQMSGNRRLGSALHSATREAKIGDLRLGQLQKELRKR